MRSMPQALLWETASHGRWAHLSIFFIAIMLPLLVYGALSEIAFDPKMQEFLALQVGFLQIVLVQLAFGVAYAQGPLSRLYPLPISTNSIVAWHMFSGAVILALEISAAACLFNTLFGVNWPILGPALFAFAAWSALQVLMSVTSLQSLPAIILGGTPAVLLCFWLNWRYGCYFSPPKHYWSEITPSDVVTLLGAFGICYVIATYSVGLARCGERIPSLGIGKWLEKKWELFVSSRTAPPPFRSAAAAQFWYEWQVKGVAHPLMTFIILAVTVTIGLGGMYLQLISLEAFCKAVLVIGGLIPLLACASGLFLGLEVDSNSAGQRDTQFGDSIAELQIESGMGCFLNSRPFSSRAFANATWRTAAQSSLIAWLMWAAVYSCCLLAIWLTQDAVVTHLPHDLGVLFIPITILGPWIAMANLASIGLSGRGARLLFILVASGVSCCVLYGVINFLTNMRFILQIHAITTTIAAAIVAVATIWAFFLAQSQKHINARTSLLAALAVCLLVFAAMALRPANASYPFYPLVIIFATLVVTPLATTPLAIAWNRHR